MHGYIRESSGPQGGYWQGESSMWETRLLAALADYDLKIMEAKVRLPWLHSAAFASWANSAVGTIKGEKPQFRHTSSSGNTHTLGLFRFASPVKWIFISAVYFVSLFEPHTLQDIRTPV
jgi:hypothetical protein